MHHAARELSFAQRFTRPTARGEYPGIRMNEKTGVDQRGPIDLKFPNADGLSDDYRPFHAPLSARLTTPPPWNKRLA